MTVPPDRQPMLIPLRGNPSLADRIRRSTGRLRHLDRDAMAAGVADLASRRLERAMLRDARGRQDVCWPDFSNDPLVTVRITTYGRARLLLERTLPSVLAQSYANLEVLVVGDGTDEETGAKLAGITDPRVRYFNLPYRPPYPPRHEDRAKIFGYQALNVSLDMARGSWIAPCDDDDELTEHHVEHLLARALEQRAELVHSNTAVVVDAGVTAVIGHERPRLGMLSHGSILYSAGLRFFRYSPSAWRLRRPLDWDLILRMRRAGVRFSHLDEITYIYYPGPASLDGWRRGVLRAHPGISL